ncbi:exosome complex exonuclease Rrp [Cordyceps militaris CM01]|uniref:Exosome complex exonuclease Rrp n=1 Tax=Cordyceps militaris (strain CM01) TaxID=983644 RepID=G3J7T7_CORMM|nr:exosome complex exonuclease Rrp [Cordyceps militaris CM01]EGX96351.1 exosome complex exonuclease Rrp [Cordyceps militaris CM01]
MAAPQDFKSLQDGVQKSLVSTVKYANRIAAEDLGFQRTVNPDAAEQLDEKSARLLDLTARLLQSAARACGVTTPALDDAEDIDLNWQGVVDVVDSVLEKADTALDEYTGLIKRKEPPLDASSKPKRTKPTGKVIRNANVGKPQILFEVQPDNFPTGPWKPIITKKPHATVPLKDSLVTFIDEDGSTQYKHPYEPEILQGTYPDSVFKVADPIPWQPTETTTAKWVDTYEDVLEMLKDLKRADEIAIDLEHHDFRTYTGLVSLMQISTRQQDWIVDTLQPWRHKLEVLNEVFADPSIVKVFHGAYMDMIWLQRDLGLYVNGLFDTYFACQQLGYSGRSLAFLLSKFADFDADKQYQLADWRIRPIPEEMLYYARSDTHYLLHIYDQVRNDLVSSSNRSVPEQDLISRALEKSRELSLSRHVHSGYNEETGEGSRGWYNYVLKHSHLAYDAAQFTLFKTIWKWRDDTARKEDESPNFVLGTNHLADVCRASPPDAKALHSLMPLTAPMARSRIDEIWVRVLEASHNPGLSLLQFFASIAPDAATRNALPKPSRDFTKLPEIGGSITYRSLSRSRLFGDIAISSRWDGSQDVDEGLKIEVPFPWQRFVASVQEGAEVDDETSPVELEAPPPAPPALVEEDEEFTLKRGTKRKSDSTLDEDSETSEESDSGEDEEGDKQMELAPMPADGIIDIDEQPKKQSKAAKKQAALEIKQKRGARRALKAQRQAEKEQKKMAAEKTYNAVPFDYSSAASVMHAKRDGTAAMASRPAKPQKVFDPYSKTGDDPLKDTPVWGLGRGCDNAARNYPRNNDTINDKEAKSESIYKLRFLDEDRQRETLFEPAAFISGASLLSLMET